eukprot:m.76654 g.76654  ORF g.76654 m.76654 type:complete len:623 (+) comp12571_c0_seq3:134-2002(+)
MYWKCLCVFTFYTTAFGITIPDISFDTAPWHFPPNATTTKTPNGTVLCLTGNANEYVKATVTLPLSALPWQVVFISDVILKDVVPGPQSFMDAKLKINANNNYYEASNIGSTFQYVWAGNAVVADHSALDGATNVTFEISIQQATGVFCSRSPRVLGELPPPEFSYPWKLPQNTTIEFAVDTKSDGTTTQFNEYLLSCNSQFVNAGIGYEDKQVMDLLQWLGLRILRFPGGTVGNFYNWKTDQFYNDTWARPKFSRAIAANFTFEYPGYAESMANLKMDSMLMFNVIEDDPEDSAMRLMARLKSLPNIPWVELGNENYDPAQGGGNLNHSDPKAYIQLTKAMVAAMRKAAGSMGKQSPLIAVNLEADNGYLSPWDKAILAENYYDGCIMHPYVVVPGAFYNLFTVAAILNASERMNNYFNLYETNFQDRPLILSEWGILGTNVGTFLQTLGQASQFMLIMKLVSTGRLNVAEAGIHILYSSNTESANALFSTHPATNNTVATPTGAWYKKMLEVFLDSSWRVTELSAPTALDNIPSLDALSVTTNNGTIAVVMVNKLNTEIYVNASVNGECSNMKYTLESFSDSPLSWNLYELSSLPWISVSGSGCKVLLPSFSMNVLWLYK